MGKMTAKHLKAAQFIAEGHTMSDVARRVGVTRQTLYAWRAEEDFRQEVERITKALTVGIMQEGIARKESRIAVMLDLHSRLLEVVRERAEAAENIKDAFGRPMKIPGARTGLMVKRQKSIGYGDSARVIEEWSVDTSVLTAAQSIQESLAKELGQENNPLPNDPLANLVRLFEDKHQEFEDAREKEPIQ